MSNYKTLILINAESPEITPDMVEDRMRDVQRRLEIAQVPLEMLTGLPCEKSGIQYALFGSESELGITIPHTSGVRVLPMNLDGFDYERIYSEIEFECLSGPHTHGSEVKHWVRGTHSSGLQLTVDRYYESRRNRALCMDVIGTLIANGITELYPGQKPYVEEGEKHEDSCPRCGYPGPDRRKNPFHPRHPQKIGEPLFKRCPLTSQVK